MQKYVRYTEAKCDADVVDILRSGGIEPEDIDTIIMKGEQSTAALNNKMKDFSDNAMKFQMDGGMSAYEFKDPDEPEDTTDIKGLMGRSH